MTKKKSKRTYLSYNERLLIEKWWNEERVTQSEIARRLGRNQGAISRELRRGSKYDLTNVNSITIRTNPYFWLAYEANRGQFYYDSHAGNTVGRSKLSYEHKLLIEKYLNEEFWSIADVLTKFKLPYSESSVRNWISHGYLAVVPKALGNKQRGYHIVKKPRVPKTLEVIQKYGDNPSNYIPKSDKKTIKVVRHHISERPVTINNRTAFGHWEADLVISRRNTRNPVLVLIERKSRYIVLVRIDSKASDDILKGFMYFILLYDQFVKSITVDNGSEFTALNVLNYLQNEANVKVFYTNTSAPYERGTNEWKNRQLRRVAGQDVDFGILTQLDLDRLSAKMNYKPMQKALNGQTPIEVFTKLSARWINKH